MGVRVICPYHPQIHNLTIGALDLHAPHAERIALGPADDAYWQLLGRLWAERESFIVIEHDIGIHPRVIPALTYCPQPWCTFPYYGPRKPDGNNGPMFKEALGCTRIRATVMREHPNLIGAIGRHGHQHPHMIARAHHWRGLDSYIAGELHGAGYQVHVHWPPVKHHHDYPFHCACGVEQQAV